MFQPLLDAYIESCAIDKVSHKPLLNIAVANWADFFADLFDSYKKAKEEEDKHFRGSVLYFVLSWHYNITKDANKPIDLVIGTPNGHTRKIFSYKETKRLFYTIENQAPDFNLFDYAIGFDELEFNNRYLRLPLYFDTLHRLAELCANDSTSPYKLKSNNPYFQNKPTNHFKTNHPNLCSVVNEEIDPFKREFTSFVASHKGCLVRENFHDALSSVGAIAGGGGK
ncbi:alpha1,3-fucosyl transferase [Helicobacter cetorum MIT 00-7128]|uniref:Alpha1,3-fucosyl transferase n=1 Tax=Helicobacter cetorum (strain ATCC BAA-429 / MIT 00-7128) TaxID=182217 RepID=I0EMI5_HELC0|nr:alpha1,3-fucosyl transferase [Helicobacter cetorum MIT 00-7128]